MANLAKTAKAMFPLVSSVIKKDTKKRMAAPPQQFAMPDFEQIQRAKRRESARTMSSGRASTILSRSSYNTLGPS